MNLVLSGRDWQTYLKYILAIRFKIIFRKILGSSRVYFHGLAILLASGVNLSAVTTTFTFTLDEPCKTSAGVYLPDGTLVRTLWSKMRYPEAGTYSATWDGLNDSSNAVVAGTYQIKLLQHNTQYVWDGAIGNTSAGISGPTVHRGFLFIQDMAIAGTNAFYCSGYNEAQYTLRNFFTTDPQHVRLAWFWAYDQYGNLGSSPGNIYSRSWLYVTADTNWVYFGCPATYNPTNLVNNSYAGCIVACKVGDNSLVYFTNGIAITNGPGYAANPFPNGIYVGTQPGLSGLSVQPNGNLLAAAVAPDNRVYLLDKHSGATITSFSVMSPGRLSFSPDGSLWVCSSNRVVIEYTNLSVNPKAATTISSLGEPLAVAVNPNNANLILVADGGGSQQIKAFDKKGTSLWTYGLLGGYQSNGVAVATNKFWFSYEGVDQTFLCFAQDGSFWVGDEESHRTMHFDSNLNYLEQIMYQPHSYKTCVDQNNPSRVFNQFLEFNVDYTKPLQQAWTLVKNWKVGVDTNHLNWAEGLYEITTFTNGRTYGLIDNASINKSELVELATNGLRFTGIFPLSNSEARWTSLGADGSVRAVTMNAARWYQSTLKGFDTVGDPLWNPETLLASAPEGGRDPVPRCCSFGNVRATISTNNVLVSFDQSLNNGWHLGGIKVGTTNWLWKTSIAGDLNGLGNYEISNGVNYAGNTLQAVDRNIIYGYHGEFFRSQGQASQHMHFYDNGLFVGQFGEASLGHSAYEGVVPGFAGNGFSPSLVKSINGEYYTWVNDESGYGPQRWHLVNARNIQESVGSGILGGIMTLTNQVVAYPTGVSGQSGNHSVTLSWQSVTNATSYKIYYSPLNGGPYTIFVGQTPVTNSVISGLNNDQTSYFAITAIINGTEGMPSRQVVVTPFDSSQTVLCAGSLTEGGQLTPVIDIDSNAPATGYPSYVGNEHLAGSLGLDDLCDYGYGSLMSVNIGTRGYALFNWGGIGTNLVQVLPPFTITVGSGWITDHYLNRQYRMDGVLGTIYGLSASPIGSINISVTDTNFHFLTVISPARFNDSRKFTMMLTSTNNTSANYTINESPGLTHTFQFLFRGNVILTADAGGGANAIVQGLFLDNVPVGSLLTPPTGLKAVPVSN